MTTLTDTLPPPPAALQGYIWRPARREDASAIHKLLIEAETVDRTGWSDSMDERERDFNHPSTDIEKDTWLAFNSFGELAAQGWIFGPDEGGEVYRAFLWGEVHPAHRGKGLGSYIMKWQEARGREILAGWPADRPRILRVNCTSHLQDRAALYEAHGFQYERSFYRMQRDLSQPILDAPLPDGVRLESWTKERDEETRQVCNEAFMDHWGFTPFTPETWEVWYSGSSRFRPEFSFLAMYENQVVGFSINQTDEESDQRPDLQEGWIQELGVLRAWRKRGIASALLAASMQAFRQAGLTLAGLGVDAESRTGAVRLYERHGFRTISEQLNFSKTI